MALSTKLELRQSQQLVMTPQLQQAIRLLQLSNVELAQFVETEIERNPLLDRDEASAEPDEQPASEIVSPAEDVEREAEGDRWLDLANPVEEPAGPPDADYDNVFPDAAAGDVPQGVGQASWTLSHSPARTSSGADLNYEAFIPAATSLKQHLEQQLPLAVRTPADRAIGQCLIEMVDEAGYLTADIPDIAGLLGVAADEVDRVLTALRTFDPPGVFARSLAECLALQLKEKDRHDPWMARLLDHLDLVAAQDLDALRKTLGIGIGDLIDMIGELKRLDPKPGLRFGTEAARPIVPDVLVRTAAGGANWIVELNPDTLPRVQVNRRYCSTVARSGYSERDRTYLQDCLQNANWLVRSLEQRARTILRVAEEIVRQQHAFLAYGVQRLRPLNLRTVADAIAMHESTVSRVTANKYMATPRGVFELKYFFTSAINGTDANESHSSEAVRERIRRLIQEETSRAVLSDDRIVELLRRGGIDIARRTVAKYREAMRIPSSVLRRRAKRLNGGG